MQVSSVMDVIRISYQSETMNGQCIWKTKNRSNTNLVIIGASLWTLPKHSSNIDHLFRSVHRLCAGIVHCVLAVV